MEIHRQDGGVENRPKSAGGRWFDLITYGGFAGVGTFFLTIPIANMFNKGGRLHGVEKAIENGVKKIGASDNLAHKVAETTRFMHGGNLMLVPVTLMEHFRTNIVNGLNRMFNDPTDPESVKDAPQQTIGSIIKGRMVAWCAVFTGFWSAEKAFPETYKTFKRECGERLCQLLRRPVKLPSGEFTKTFHFGESAALDAFATASAATLLYVGSHIFARRAQIRREEKQGVRHGREGAHIDEMPAHETRAENAPATKVSTVSREAEPLAQAPATAQAV